MKKIIPFLIVVVISLLFTSCPDFLGSEPAGRWNPVDENYDADTDPDAVDDGTDDGTITVTISRLDDLPSTTPVRSVTWTWDASVSGCSFRNIISTTPPLNFGGFDSDWNDATTITRNTGDGTYYLYVEARGPDGVTLSEVTSASALLDNTPPNPIVDLGASAGVNTVNLYWTNPTEDFAGVELRYDTWGAGSCPSTPTDGDRAYNGDASSFLHESLTPATEYNYSIFAYDEAGNYADRGILTVDTLAAATGPVTGFTATGFPYSVFLQWTNPLDAGFDGVMIRYSDGGGYPATPDDGLLAYDGTAEEFDHMYLTPSHTYYYSAFAYDTEGYHAVRDTAYAEAQYAASYSGLLAQYLFFGDSDDYALPGGNDLDAYGFPQLTEDRFGVTNRAYIFDGTNDYMESPVGNENSLDLPSQYGISIWFKPNDIATTGQYILSKSSSGAGFDIYVFNNDLCIDVNQTVIIQEDITSLDGQWIHLVVTNDSSFKVYIQNVLVVDAGAPIAPNNSTNALRVGSGPGAGGDQFFNGVIDDIEIFDEALDADAVSTLYHYW